VAQHDLVLAQTEETIPEEAKTTSSSSSSRCYLFLLGDGVPKKAGPGMMVMMAHAGIRALESSTRVDGTGDLPRLHSSGDDGANHDDDGAASCGYHDDYDDDDLGRYGGGDDDNPNSE
jgi:hypothetical protein